MRKASVVLLLISLIFLAATLCIHWRINLLEAEQESLYQQIYYQQNISTQDISRSVDISRQLQGTYGLYYYRNRAAVCAALTGFACLCVNMERLKKWLHKEK